MKEMVYNQIARLNVVCLQAVKRVSKKLNEDRGDGALQMVIGILITITIGAVLFAAFTTLFGDQDNDQSLIGSVVAKIKDLFQIS